MVRKLLLLLVTICMAMAPGGDITVAQLQCQTAVLLLTLFLALHLWMKPFKCSLLNILDSICQLATTMTYGLLMFLALVPSFRGYITGGNPDDKVPTVAMALLVIMLGMNLLVLAYVLARGGRVVYKVLNEEPEAVEWKRRATGCFQRKRRAACRCA